MNKLHISCSIFLLFILFLYLFLFKQISLARWSLLVLGASSLYALICIFSVYFLAPRTFTHTLLIFFAFSLSLFFGAGRSAPQYTDGDPSGLMLSSLSIQSISHSISVVVPTPKTLTKRLRIRVKLAKPYDGQAHFQVQLETFFKALMDIPEDGDSMYREYRFETPPFLHSRETCQLILSVDAYDRNMRLAYWQSNAGRADHSDVIYSTEHGSFIGIPESLIGGFVNGWPFLWIENV
mgnify:CR=1 FL=1